MIINKPAEDTGHVRYLMTDDEQITKFLRSRLCMSRKVEILMKLWRSEVLVPKLSLLCLSINLEA